MEITFDVREFLRKTKHVILKPKAFYHSVEKEQGWKDALSYAIAIAAISSLLNLLLVTLLYPVLRSALPNIFEDGPLPQVADLLPAFFISTVIVVLLGFVWAKVLHFWFKAMKLHGEYWAVYRTYIYSRAPIAIFGWIPYLGGIFGIYSIYVLAVGLSVHYKITLKKAILLLIPPLVALFVLQTVLFVLAGQAPS